MYDMNWKDIQIEGVSEIERMTLELRVSTYLFPYLNCGFRIYESQQGSFKCRPEIAVRNKDTNELEKILGEGSTEREAFENAMTTILTKLRDNIENFSPDTIAQPYQTVYLHNHEY